MVRIAELVLSGSRPQMLAMPVAIVERVGRGEQRRSPRERLLAPRRLPEPERGVPQTLELAGVGAVVPAGNP